MEVPPSHTRLSGTHVLMISSRKSSSPPSALTLSMLGATTTARTFFSRTALRTSLRPHTNQRCAAACGLDVRAGDVHGGPGRDSHGPEIGTCTTHASFLPALGCPTGALATAPSNKPLWLGGPRPGAGQPIALTHTHLDGVTCHGPVLEAFDAKKQLRHHTVQLRAHHLPAQRMHLRGKGQGMRFGG